MKTWLLVGCLALGALDPRGSREWGGEGHRIVGAIATSYLSESALSGCAALLEGQTLAEVSTWADEVRGQSAYAWSRPLHYLNVPDGATDIDLLQDCPDEACVVAAVSRFEKTLRKVDATVEEKREALKFLVHFVGDLHQPLHVARGSDKGGNEISVVYSGRGSVTLHAAWDTYLVREVAGEDWGTYAAVLRGGISEQQAAEWRGSMDPLDWANESLALAISAAYPIPAAGVLDAAYLEQGVAVVERRLQAAGVRLAAVLNSVFAGVSDPDGTVVTGTTIGTMRIATFNIQNLGPTKAGKLEIMDQLAAIIRTYDVVAVQEVTDISGGAPQMLLDRINATDPPYVMSLSPRTGVQPDDKTYQEQYAFYFNSSTIAALDEGWLVDDAAQDAFQREPFVQRFHATAGNFTFVLVTVHTQPDAAVSETGALEDVVQVALTTYPGEDDVVVLGDFNVSCSYASPAELDALDLRSSFYTWIVPDDADTTLSDRTHCAYDRIVITQGALEDYTSQWGVHQAFTDKAVSDHWPVWAEFFVGRDL